MRVPGEPEPPTGAVSLANGERLTPPVLEQALRAEAAQRWKRTDLGANLSVQIEAVAWRDGSLGCPMEDRMYTQAVVPGWRVLVGDGKRTARYHVSWAGSWVLCPADREQAPLPNDATR
jgi:hypothetical protein